MDLQESSSLIVRELLAVQPGENVLIICDFGSSKDMAESLAMTVQDVGADYTIGVMPIRPIEQANNLTKVLEKALEGADCLIGLTRHSGAPTYSSAVKSLYNKKKLRTISMVMRDEDHFTRGGALADYPALYVEGQRLASLWENARQIHITSPVGTDLTSKIGAFKPLVECGFATQAGQEAAFSDGEVSQGPDEGTAEGVIVLDGPICYLGLPDGAVELEVVAGRVVGVNGEGETADKLREILRTIPNADNIAEIGIGLNPCSLANGDFEEEKKRRGNVHIALGDNIFYGGNTKSPVHMDVVIYSPTVVVDDIMLVNQGEIILPEEDI